MENLAINATLDMVNKMTMAAAAAHYRACGWWPIPLREKSPITNWTTDPLLTDQQLALLFPDQPPMAPHLNLGIRMGAVSGIIALDIDGQAGREFLTQRLQPNELHELQQTLQFSTPNGHRLIYRYPNYSQPSQSFRDPVNRQRELVRILSDGTQTVAPPSDINGKPYLWCNQSRLNRYPLAPWPADIAAKLDTHDARTHTHMSAAELVSEGVLHPTQHGPALPIMIAHTNKTRRAAAYLLKCDPAVSGQRGHDQTYKIAVRLIGGFQLTYHEALLLLTEIYNPTCQPPWSDAELEHKIESALKDTKPVRNML